MFTHSKTSTTKTLIALILVLCVTLLLSTTVYAVVSYETGTLPPRPDTDQPAVPRWYGGNFQVHANATNPKLYNVTIVTPLSSTATWSCALYNGTTFLTNTTATVINTTDQVCQFNGYALATASTTTYRILSGNGTTPNANSITQRWRTTTAPNNGALFNWTLTAAGQWGNNYDGTSWGTNNNPYSIWKLQISEGSPALDKTINTTLINTINNTVLNSYCVTYTGNGTGTSCTTNGTIYIFNKTGEITLNYFNITNYYNQTKIQNITSDTTVTAYTYQALLNLTVGKLYLNTSITSYNARNNLNTTGYGQLAPANNGSNNLQINVTGNYTINYTCTASQPLTTTDCTINQIYDHLLLVNATDIWNNARIQNFSLTTTNNSVLSITNTTTNYAINLTLLRGYTYNLQFSTTNGTYEYANYSHYAQNASQYYQFEILPAPSIDITIRDINGNLITQNMTISLTSDTTGELLYTTTGGYFVTDITNEEYTIKIYNTNYSIGTYTVTATNGAVYFLTTYLQGNVSEATFQVVDSISSTVSIAGATITQQALVNGIWSTINTKQTDITGRVSIGYTPDTAYKFIVTADGYTTKSFSLDPILFSSYTIKLQKSTVIGFDQDYQNVVISYNPKTYYNNANNSINITFYSPNGALTAYSYTIEYLGGTSTGNGVSSNGQTLSPTIEITGATITDKVNITLSYTTDGDPHTFNYNHNIIVAPGSNTFIANKNNTYGLGLIERLLIGTIIIIIVAGIATVGAGSIVGLLIGIFTMGIWIYIGFWPWWAAGISLLLGFTLLARRTT